MSDDTHVTDVGGLVHKGPDLIYREVAIGMEVSFIREYAENEMDDIHHDV